MLWLGLSVTGCTSVLGIDGQYVEGEVNAGGAGGKHAGGGGGAGVDAASGSSGGGGDQSGGGGTTGQGAGGTADCPSQGCPTGTKCCLVPSTTASGTFCAAPEPAIGCSLTAGCQSCPLAPQNAKAACKGEQCGFDCFDGFAVSSDGTQCDPLGTGGVTGQGGAGAGGKPPCDPKKCPGANGSGPGCSIASPLACCTKNDTCGCTWAGPLYCF